MKRVVIIAAFALPLSALESTVCVAQNSVADDALCSVIRYKRRGNIVEKGEKV
jgi:hypothetical protein